MHDSEVVAAIAAGDPDGLAEAYDRYAAPLYTYCRSLLREPADAADAVQDTFVIAASKVAGLRDQSRLRPWLYAVARNECHRRLRDKASAATSALDQVPEMSDESSDVSEGAERAELRALLRSAVRGLGASEQDLIQLQLRQELDVAEIAAMLGVSRNHAHALLSRARAQLEISLGALLVARSGQGDCESLGALLQDWDGELNVLMRKRINRHIERCPACTERKRRELAPALLLGLAPLPIAVMPPGLRSQVLRLVSSDTPDAVAHRASVTQRAVMSGPGGFPKPLDPPKSAWWQDDRAQRAVRRQPETDRLGRAGVVVHHGVLRPDRQAVRGSGLGPPAGRAEHDGQRQRQRRAPGPGQPGRDRERGRGVRGLPAHRQPGRHRGLGHHRGRRHSEFTAAEHETAELGQPGSGGGQRAPRRPASELSRCA
jgi:RNA polymerase sigma factor (sigma-70 family)